MTSIVVAVAVYIVGIVAGTVGFGAWKKPGKEMTFDGLDYALFTVVALFWPFLAVAAGAGLLVLLVGYGVLYLPIRLLLKFGVWLGEWPERRAEKRQNTSKLQKNGQGKSILNPD